VGQDQQGSYTIAAASLAAVRLRISTWRRRHQPSITHRIGTTVIVFNGEIYNFRALRVNSNRMGTGSSRIANTELFSRVSCSGTPIPLLGCMACSQWRCD
jgi:asparagine synthetase B (glutamine-hydrolysing)